MLALDTVRMRATLLRAYPHSPPVLAFALGNVQLLPNGNVLVGYGTASRLTEFSADGTPLLDLRLPENEVNYRGFRFPWIGRPLGRPRLALAPTGLYVSWNGATEVSAWELRTGPASGRLRAAETRPRAGFETAFALPAGARYAVAVARDGDGRPLAESNTVEL